MKYFIVLFLTAVLFYSCNKSSTGPTTVAGAGFTSLAGKIESWTGGTGSFLKLFSEQDNNTVVGTSAIDANGNFNISTISDLPAAHMKAISTDLPAGLSADNPNVKTGTAFLYITNSTGTQLHMLLEGVFANTAQATAGDFYAMYVLADGAASVTGSYTEAVQGGTIKYTYNLQVVKGWNKVIHKITKATSNSQERDVISAFPGTPKWFVP